MEIPARPWWRSHLKVLAVNEPLHAVVLRRHICMGAAGLERAVGPEGARMVGIDGGYVRAPHTANWSEVIARRRLLACKRGEET
jgi:hypothetical protein